MSQIVYRKITELTPLENNPRTIKSDEFDKLCKSLKDNPDYFEARPLILSNRTKKLVIIAGNQRFKAAQKLGFDKVPTFLIENLTQEREKEIIIRDNVNNGDWDYDILADWNTDELKDWGVDIIEQEFVAKKEKIQLKPFKQSHILISFSPEQLMFIEKHLQAIKEIEGVEIEMSAN